jgi:hypothetical protein
MVPLAAAVRRQCDRAKKFRTSKPIPPPIVNPQSQNRQSIDLPAIRTEKISSG